MLVRMVKAGVLPESECAEILATAEARVRERLCTAGHAMPADVIGPITIGLTRYRAPFFLISADAREPALNFVGGLDSDALIALFLLRRLTLGQALEQAASTLARVALNTIYTEVVIVAHKRWTLGELRAGRIIAADVPAAATEVGAEIQRAVLATPLSKILRARGNHLAPLLQALIVPTHERLCRFYSGKPHISRAELAALDPDKPTRRVRAHYPGALLRDIADFVTGHWGHVLGRIDPKDVKSCLQRRIHRGDGAGS